MKAVVLVGGEGTRMRPLTHTTPKPLLPIVEVPMIERVVSHLAAHGVEEVVLSLAYQPNSFIEAYPAATVAGVRLSYAVEPQPLDTAGAVRFAAHHAEVDDTFLVVNGDVLTDLDVSALVEFHRRKGAAATIHLTEVEDPSRFGVVLTGEDGRVVEFIEKPAREQAPTNLINAGTYVLEPVVLEGITLGTRTSIERETFPALAREGGLYAQPSDAYWLDIGTPEAYLDAHADLVSGCSGADGPPAPGARAAGRSAWVIDEPDLSGELGPRSLVGARAALASGSKVSDSVVGALCVLEADAVVEHSVLLPGARVCAGARLRGSIVGHDARIGEGCELLPVTVVGDREEVVAGTRLEGARVPAEAAS